VLVARVSAATSRSPRRRSCTPGACSSWRRRFTCRACPNCAPVCSIARRRSARLARRRGALRAQRALRAGVQAALHLLEVIIGCTTRSGSSSTCSNTSSSHLICPRSPSSSFHQPRDDQPRPAPEPAACGSDQHPPPSPHGRTISCAHCSIGRPRDQRRAARVALDAQFAPSAELRTVLCRQCTAETACAPTAE